MNHDLIIRRISDLTSDLKSFEILDVLRSPFNINKLDLLSLVLQSKTAFDQAMTDDDLKQFLKEIEQEAEIYGHTYLDLLLVICSAPDNGRLDIANIFLQRLSLFHKVISCSMKLVNALSEAVPVEKEDTNAKVIQIPPEDSPELRRFLKSFAEIA
jgi:hypothetical protein